MATLVMDSPCRPVLSTGSYSLEAFSDLTPVERGESVWQSRIRCAVSLCLLCLGIAMASGGITALVLLSQALTPFSIAFIAIGSVLFVMGILLCLAIRSRESLRIEGESVRDLQQRLKQLLTSIDRQQLIASDFNMEGNPLESLRKREMALADFDRELRKKEPYFYRDLATQTTNRHSLLLDLSEFREMQARVSDELELLYRCYDRVLVGEGEETRNHYLIGLFQEKEHIVQEILDAGKERERYTQEIESIQGELKSLMQHIPSVSSDFDGDMPQHEVTQVCATLAKRNQLLDKLSTVYKDLSQLLTKENTLIRKRDGLLLEIQTLIEQESSDIMLNQDYRQAYLKATISVNHLKSLLHEKENMVSGLLQEVESCKEVIAALKNEQRSLKGYSQQEIDEQQKRLDQAEVLLDVLKQQVSEYRELLVVSQKENEKIKKALQSRYEDVRTPLEEGRRALETNLRELQERLDSHSLVENTLADEISRLKGVASILEEQMSFYDRVVGLKEKIQGMAEKLEVMRKEKEEQAEASALLRMDFEQEKKKNSNLKKILFLRDEQVVLYSTKIEALSELIMLSREKLEHLKQDLEDGKNILDIADGVHSLLLMEENKEEIISSLSAADAYYQEQSESVETQ